MIQLGMANSRMKDFYDIWLLAQLFEFKGKTLIQAIDRTFKRRHTVMPDRLPLPLTEEFSTDQVKKLQWHAFVRRSSLAPERIELKEVIRLLEIFLWTPCQALKQGAPFLKYWKAGGPWTANP
jgi:hypothetical protein